jgi:hypothetical protein
MPCLNPRRMTIHGFAREFACQKCLECRKGRVRDLVGRALAEQKYAVGSHFITLTYGVDRKVDGASDVKGAVVLTYSHVQNWLKRLRDAGYPMRYVIAGEYGSKKGRSHWHCILYWQEKVPPVPEHVEDNTGARRAWNDPWWKPIGGGHTQWADVDAGTVRYVAKYSLKSVDDRHAQSIVRVSKNPLIGARYFDHWAKLHVDQELAIKSRYYRIAGSVDPSTGKLWNYWMTDAALRYVILSYGRQWRETYGDRHMPVGTFMEEQFDKLAVPIPDPDRPLAVKRFSSRPYIPTPNGEEVLYDEKRNAYYFELGRTKDYRPSNPVRCWWSFDENGQREWSFNFVSVPEGERLLRAFLDGVTGKAADDYRAASGRSSR